MADINIKTDIPALYLALKDKRTPVPAKIFACIAVGYALSPIDLIPDFIPVLGYLDDLVILPVLIAITVKLIPSEILTEYREKSRSMWAGGKPKKWYYAIPIILVWVFIVALIIGKIVIK